MTLRSKSAWSIANFGRKYTSLSQASFPDPYGKTSRLTTFSDRSRSNISGPISFKQFTSSAREQHQHVDIITGRCFNEPSFLVPTSPLQRTPTPPDLALRLLGVQHVLPGQDSCSRRNLSTTSCRSSQGDQVPPPPVPPVPPQQSKAVLLKSAVKDYGSTVIVFHVAISLVSLGGFYTAVSSGLDVVSLLAQLPLVGEKIAGSNFGAGASTFVVAYAVHKVFAPVRMSITLTATPFIVKYLRSKGILKV